ncbi:MAG: aldehyde:ferredoxin oxidoreductase [Actinobacteria bacterium HGW-Actinobacteria-6]|nr:MAG: aldehyde:ferredoxin oxidoreductase [Actinobacteria bacterium HGW-Actinobacteria-6]
MATGGYVGKILFVNLTDRSTEEIATSDYEEYGGGHGIGSALFFERVKDKTIDGFHPDNLVTFMTSPLSGTLAPSASGRTETGFISVHSYPIGWYTRSNFGGRFSGMLKYAGWDGIAIQGASKTPVWINIVNGKVTFEDASGLWGLDTYETQEEIWSTVSHGNAADGTWYGLDTSRDSGRTTQRPAVATIGPAGENLVRSAIVLHDAGNAAGQGGLGAVLGSKNLKAVSVIGTGSIPVADPKSLVDIRFELQNRFGYNVDEPTLEAPVDNFSFYGAITSRPGYGPLILGIDQPARPQGCMGCFKNCRRKLASGVSNEDQCVESLFYMAGETQAIQNQATDMIDKLGLNVYDVKDHDYLYALYKMGVLGVGKAIDTDLPFDKYGSYEFIDAYTKAIAFREGIGDDLAEGIVRASAKWGRLEEDLASGLLKRPNWGYAEHYNPRLEVEWSYGSIFGDRDINEHGFNWHVYWMAYIRSMVGQDPIISAEEVASRLAEATGLGDPMGFDYSEVGIYGEPKAKVIAYHRHYTRFWKQSVLYCDWAWPMYINYNSDDHTGATPEYEPKIFNAVTGKNISFADGLEIGRKIWNLDKSIWVLQGRHREQEVFAGYVYDEPNPAPYSLPVYENGEWSFSDNLGRSLDREKFEGFKDLFFGVEGWDKKTGWPTRATLSGLGLDNVADALESAGKLGS